MTGSQKRQFRQRFQAHLYPVRTFRGDPTRPAYTLYSLHQYPTYLAAMNELDELIDQWPRNRPRTVALLAVRRAFFDSGAVHWEVGMVYDEDKENVHGLMLNERRLGQRSDPAKAARHAHHFALAEAALVESQRRKQGPPTGACRPPIRRGRVKVISLPRLLSRQAQNTVSSALQRVDELIQEARLSPLA